MSGRREPGDRRRANEAATERHDGRLKVVVSGQRRLSRRNVSCEAVRLEAWLGARTDFADSRAKGGVCSQFWAGRSGAVVTFAL